MHYIDAMRSNMSDDELKQVMRSLTRVADLPLTEQRIENDAAAYKTLLNAIDKIDAIDVPLDSEPFIPKK